MNLRSVPKIVNLYNANCAQKLECFARIHQLFEKLASLDSDDIHSIIKYLQVFSRLVFSFDLTNEEINKMKGHGTVLHDILLTYLPVPKTHLLLHYSDMAEEYGPPALYTAFKFERLHQRHKRRAEKVFSRRNITKTLVRMWTFENALLSCEKEGK